MENYTFILSSRPPSEVGPIVGELPFQLSSHSAEQVIATFPSTEPPVNTPFSIYYTDKKAADTHNEVDFSEQRLLLAGEGKKVEFVTADVPAEHGAGTK